MKVPYHQQVLIDAINLAMNITGDSASDIAIQSGVNGSSLSRFMNGKQDLKAGDYFDLLNSLPDVPKRSARQKLGIGMPEELDLVTLVLAASPKEKVEILNALASAIGDWVLESRAHTKPEQHLEAV